MANLLHASLRARKSQSLYLELSFRPSKAHCFLASFLLGSLDCLLLDYQSISGMPTNERKAMAAVRPTNSGQDGSSMHPFSQVSRPSNKQVGVVRDNSGGGGGIVADWFAR